jgi:hypothetical protein
MPPRVRRRRRRRLPRILLNAATAVSLALFVATAVLWLRSYGRDFAVRRFAVRVSSTTQHLSQYTLYAREGDVRVTTFSLDHPRVPSPYRDRYLTRNPGGTSWQWWSGPKSALGFDAGGMGLYMWMRLAGFDRNLATYPPRSTDFSVPVGPVCLACAVLPVLWAYRLGWLRFPPPRNKTGRCPACGYDLRATPDRCPECGTVPPAAPPAR